MDLNNAPTSSEPAPSYEHIFADHPVNRQPPSGSSKAYAPVPHDDDHEEEQQRHHHHHNGPDPEANATPSVSLQTLTDGSRPHVHCEACDGIAERRERQKGESHCCTMVAVTFIMAFVCLMIVGIVLADKIHHA